MDAQRTIARLWSDAVAERPAGETAYLTREGEAWRPVTWSEAATTVTARANGFLARGLRRGDAYGILARTTLDWALTDFALARVGAVTAPVYATSSPHDVRHVLEHSEAVGVLCEDEEQRAKVEAVRAHLPGLREVLTFADLEALDAEGAAYATTHPAALDDATAQVAEEDLFTFIYTSGTTGPPKGCMIRHRNYYEMASVVLKMPRYVEPGDVCLLYLPLAHNFGRLVHLTGPLAGYAIAFEPDPYAVANAMLAVRPTVFPSVPRVYEKVHAAVVSAFDEATGARRKLVAWALAVGREAGELRRRGEPLPRGLAVRRRVADRLVYSKVKARLGGRLRLPISGGAPLGTEVAELFDALDIRIMEGYGLTECTSAGTSNHLQAYRYGTVGRALPGVELRLAADGELEMRSETIFAGYYKDPAATAEVLSDDGWLRTGDIATIDVDGFVTITDRKKDIIVTAGGKNIAPQNLENDLKASRFVSQALVVGDRRPYVVALVTLDEPEIARWASERGIDASLPDLAGHPDVTALVQSVVDEVNSDRTRFEQIKRFAVLPRDFQLEQGEVTPTLKLKRRVCVEHFAGEVEALYAAGSADPAADSG
jgi:long-chain acyl-CoA synthetase